MFADLDTLTIKSPVRLQDIASKLDMPYEDLQFLNPSFRYGFIPSYPGSNYALRLPKKYVADFLKNEQQLYADYQLKAFDAAQFAQQDEPEYILKKTSFRVRKGQNLTSIAKKYHVLVSEVKRWNHIRKAVRPGQYLAVYTRVKNPNWSPPENLAQKNTPPQNNQKGDENTISPTNNELTLAANTDETAIQADSLSGDNQSENDSAEQVKGEKASQVKTKEGISQDSKLNSKASSKPEKVKTIKVTKQVANPPKFHSIRRGENLGGIAKKYHVTVTNLLAWNKLRKHTVQAGQRLRVNPPYTTVRQTVEVADTETTARNTDTSSFNKKNVIIYTVRSEDTLWSIAQKYQGITVQQIMEWNNLNDKNVKVGQRIKLLLSGG